MAAKNFGRIPESADRRPTPTGRLLQTVQPASVSSVTSLRRSRQKAAIQEAMRAVADANSYISDQAPWTMKDDPVRQGTVLHTALQSVRDLNTILTPFLPHAHSRSTRRSVGSGTWSAMPEIRAVTEEPGTTTIRSSWATTRPPTSRGRRWETQPLVAGTSAGRPRRRLHEARPVGRGRGAGSARQPPTLRTALARHGRSTGLAIG